MHTKIDKTFLDNQCSRHLVSQVCVHEMPQEAENRLAQEKKLRALITMGVIVSDCCSSSCSYCSNQQIHDCSWQSQPIGDNVQDQTNSTTIVFMNLKSGAII
jgi:hypothetical protein